MIPNSLEQVETHIHEEFIIERCVGKGSYGIVFKAIDRRTNKKYAIKKIFGAFKDKVDAKRTVREVSFLYQLSQHKHVVKLEKVIKSQNENDLYLVFEYLESDLHKVIYSNTIKLQSTQQAYIITQILLVLQYIHSGGLIHRDLKPSNFLINKQCIVKLADFGLARTIQELDETNPVLTGNVATQFYRPPEILFGSKYYSSSADMWSVGCILFEMLTGKVMFKAESNQNQIKKIIEFLGVPNDSAICSFNLEYPEQIRTWLFFEKGKQNTAFISILDTLDPNAKDFILKCIRYNTQQRMTAQQALQHPYVKSFTVLFQEQFRDVKFTTLKNDDQLYSVKEYQDILYKFLNCNHGDIYRFKRDNNRKVSQQIDQNARNIIQNPIRTISQYSRTVQKTEQANETFFGPHLITLGNQVSSPNALRQVQLQNNLTIFEENKNNQFHKPIVNNNFRQSNNLRESNNFSIQQAQCKGGRRLSLQTNYSQNSNLDHQINQQNNQKQQKCEHYIEKKQPK